MVGAFYGDHHRRWEKISHLPCCSTFRVHFSGDRITERHRNVINLTGSVIALLAVRKMAPVRADLFEAGNRGPRRYVHGNPHRRVYVNGDPPTGGVDLRG